MKRKHIINIINFPGSGTHFLMDIMAMLNIPHNPILDVIVKIIQLRKNNHLQISGLKIKRKNLFKKIYNKILDNNFLNDAKNFSKVLEYEILNKIEKDSFIMMPQIFYEDNNYNLSLEELSFIKEIFSYLDNSNQTFINVAYLRHPNDILNSKINRFYNQNNIENINNEIKQIVSFYNLNKNEINSNHIKYEDMVRDKENSINNISQMLKLEEKDITLLLKNFYIYSSSRNYRKLFDFKNEIKFLNNIYTVDYFKDKEFKSSIIQKNVDQFKIIYSYLVKMNYFNDSAFHRTKRTIFSRIFFRFLLLFPSIKKNYNKLTDPKFRERKKHLISGI